MPTVYFVTGNQGKWAIARDIFSQHGVELNQCKVDTPEIQSLDVSEVAKFSAKFAHKETGFNVMKSDVGYYIPALGNFPGPFIKFINQTLTTGDFLSLMHGKDDRTVILRECLAYVGTDGEPRGFISEQKAKIALTPEGSGSMIDQLLILDGFSKPKGTYSAEEIFEHWKSTLDVYHKVASYVSENSAPMKSPQGPKHG